MSNKVRRLEEREKRLLTQARVWDKHLVQLIEHQEVYDDMLQDFIDKITYKVKMMRRKAEECRHKSIWL